MRELGTSGEHWNLELPLLDTISAGFVMTKPVSIGISLRCTRTFVAGGRQFSTCWTLQLVALSALVSSKNSPLALLGTPWKSVALPGT